MIASRRWPSADAVARNNRRRHPGPRCELRIVHARQQRPIGVPARARIENSDDATHINCPVKKLVVNARVAGHHALQAEAAFDHLAPCAAATHALLGGARIESDARPRVPSGSPARTSGLLASLARAPHCRPRASPRSAGRWPSPREWCSRCPRSARAARRCRSCAAPPGYRPEAWNPGELAKTGALERRFDRLAQHAVTDDDEAQALPATRSFGYQSHECVREGTWS